MRSGGREPFFSSLLKDPPRAAIPETHVGEDDGDNDRRVERAPGEPRLAAPPAHRPLHVGLTELFLLGAERPLQTRFTYGLQGCRFGSRLRIYICSAASLHTRLSEQELCQTPNAHGLPSISLVC